jgi:hypothetical protein
MKTHPDQVESRPFNSMVHVLLNPLPWALKYGDRVNSNCPVFVHVQKWTKDRFGDSTVPVGPIELLDINGAIEGEPIEPASLLAHGIEPSRCAVEIPDRLLKLLRVTGKKRASSAQLLDALAHVMDDNGGPWGEFRQLLNTDRFECSVWFERDRKNVSLTDLLDGREIFSLWDDDVDQAIEDGFLSVPLVPRATEKQWLPHALGYARDAGYLRPLLEDASNTPAAPRARLRLSTEGVGS